MNNQNTNQINEDDLLDDPRQAYLSKEKVNVVALKTLETTLSSIEQKKIIDRLNKSFLASEKAKKNYVFSVIKLGEELLEAKQSVGFGCWEVFIKRHSEFRFDERQARKYMQIAKHKNLVLTFFTDQKGLTVNQLTKLIAGATQEQIDEANATTEKKVKPPAPLLPDKPIDREEVKDHQPPGGERGDDVIDGEYTVDPPIPDDEQPDEEYTDLDALHDRINDLLKENQALESENKRLKLIVESDKNLVELNKKFSELEAINAGIQSSLDGQMSTTAAMQERINWLERQLKKEKKVSNEQPAIRKADNEMPELPPLPDCFNDLDPESFQ